MTTIGYSLSSEEHAPNDLVRCAQRAEEIGFEFAMISDHFHPWIDQQGQSPFVWSVIGAIAHATTRLRLGTGVTCPTVRIHPAIVAQAAATAAAMMPGRFMLGVGSGEALNEHIVGQRWPAADVRLEMLEEAVEVIRKLWQGGYQDHHGRFYTVENARLYTLPDQPPPLLMAAGGSKSSELAGRISDGMISTAPVKKLVEQFRASGGEGKPRYGQLTVCWAASEAEAVRTAHQYWPNSSLKGELGQELPTPQHFEQATALVRDEDIAKSIVCGPDAERHRAAVQEFVDAGFEYVYVHQVGPDQEGFFRFYEQEVLPRFR